MIGFPVISWNFQDISALYKAHFGTKKAQNTLFPQ